MKVKAGAMPACTAPQLNSADAAKKYKKESCLLEMPDHLKFCSVRTNFHKGK